MADISKMNVNGTEYNIKDATARQQDAALAQRLNTVGNALNGLDSEIADVRDSVNSVSAVMEGTFNKFCYECERIVGFGDTTSTYAILERTRYEKGVIYGINEIIMSGYIKWTENGRELASYFCANITRQCQGIGRGNASTFTVPVLACVNNGIPRMGTIKVTVLNGTSSGDYYGNQGAAGDVQFWMNCSEAKMFIDDVGQSATCSSIKVRTILTRYMEQK